VQHPTLVHAVARERHLDLARRHSRSLARVLDDSRRPAAAIRSTDPQVPAPWPVQPPPEIDLD
jgi:hypothetical protein